MKYRKKPVVIEARQYFSETQSELLEWCKGYLTIDDRVTKIAIPTLEGKITASIGDYIIQGVQGEFYPCKPDIFEKTYELVQ